MFRSLLRNKEIILDNSPLYKSLNRKSVMEFHGRYKRKHIPDQFNYNLRK